MKHNETDCDTRLTWRRFPSCFQPFLTWLSGKPLPEELPWRIGIWHHFASAILSVLIGLILSVFFCHYGITIPLIAVAWVIEVHGMRKLRTGIMHFAAHQNFTRNRKHDNIIGTIISIFLCSESHASYTSSHVGDHHGVGHMSMNDPTVQFLILRFGLRGGMARKECWNRVWMKLLSPTFYIKTLYNRIATHFNKTTFLYRTIFVSYHIIFTFLFIILTGMTGWIVGWLIPISIIYTASAALRLCSRHTFPKKGCCYTHKETICSFTDGIFIGDPAPNSDGILLWIYWWLKLIFFHIPSRCLILPMDGPAHDHHHRAPRHPKWFIYPFIRRDEALMCNPSWPPYTETWGVWKMIDKVFTTLEKADPLVYHPDAKFVRVPRAELSAALYD